ncbi:MAG: hypothetical protein JWM86_331 [Thermoleophilia bacterium]|nr:hypothetical protein [Thermoleophilia bacterium]
MRSLRSTVAAFLLALLVVAPSAGAVAADLHGTVSISATNEYDITGSDGAVAGHDSRRTSATFAIDRYVTMRFPTAHFTPRDVVHTITRSDELGCVHEETTGLDTTRDPVFTTVPLTVGGDVQNRLTGTAVLSLGWNRTFDQPFYRIAYTNVCGEPLAEASSRPLFEAFEAAGSFPGAKSAGPLLLKDPVVANLRFTRGLTGTWRSSGTRTAYDAASLTTTTTSWNLSSRNPSPNCSLPARRTMIGGRPTAVVAALRRAGVVPVITRTSQLRNVPRGRVAQVSYIFRVVVTAPCGARVAVYVRQ